MDERKYGDYPTLEEIVRDYYELMEIIGNVTTVKQAEALEDKFTIEINGISRDEFVNGMKFSDGTRRGMKGTDRDIEWIRYENYGCLSYIYCYIDGGKVTSVIFDVWSNRYDNEFIENVTINEVQTSYDRYARALEEYCGMNIMEE